jgi:hypothetical protein
MRVRSQHRRILCRVAKASLGELHRISAAQLVRHDQRPSRPWIGENLRFDTEDVAQHVGADDCAGGAGGDNLAVFHDDQEGDPGDGGADADADQDEAVGVDAALPGQEIDERRGDDRAGESGDWQELRRLAGGDPEDCVTA